VKRATKEVSNLAIAEVVPTLTKWIDQDKNWLCLVLPLTPFLRQYPNLP
jgi:hypothetical protein